MFKRSDLSKKKFISSLGEKALPLLAVMNALFPTLVCASPLGSEWLKISKPLSVVVNSLSASLRNHGLSEQRLQTRVEQKLRKNGIEVDSASNSEFLAIEITGDELAKDIPQLYYKMELSLHENVIRADELEQKSGSRVLQKPLKDVLINATTWSTSCVGHAGNRVFAEAVDQKLDEQVDEFIHDVHRSQKQPTKVPVN